MLPDRWLEAVLAAYMAAVVLPAPPNQQLAAEQQLLAALAGLQAAAAAQGLLHSAAQKAVGAAAAQVLYTSSSSSCCAVAGGDSLVPLSAERPILLAEALEHLTSPACLEVAAAAQLLLQHAGRLTAQPQQDEATHQQQDQQPPLGRLLHSPPSRLEVQMLCLAALLPAWEATLRRLAGLDDVCRHGAGSNGSSNSSSTSSTSSAAATAHQAVHLLCSACASQPEALLAQHPALVAEVCRQSFRFTACFAPLLAGHVAEAADLTRAAAEAARWRAAHMTKHADHVTDYFLLKCSGASAAGPAMAPSPSAADPARAPANHFEADPTEGMEAALVDDDW